MRNVGIVLVMCVFFVWLLSSCGNTGVPFEGGLGQEGQQGTERQRAEGPGPEGGQEPQPMPDTAPIESVATDTATEPPASDDALPSERTPDASPTETAGPEQPSVEPADAGGQEPPSPDTAPVEQPAQESANNPEPPAPDNAQPPTYKACPGYESSFIYPVKSYPGTLICPAQDSKVFYVSTQGSDNNDGLSPSKPFATLDKAKNSLRALHPDWIVLKRGDTFNKPFGVYRSRTGTPRGGRSQSEPVVISAYGQGTTRPVIATTGQNAFDIWGIDHITISGLALKATIGSGGTGIRSLSGGKNHVYDDNLIQGYQVNMVVQGDSGNQLRFENIRIDSNIVLDSATGGGGNGHSQGIFASYVFNMVFENNLFDICGWYKDRDGQASGSKIATIFNHCLYLQYNSGPSRVVNNIIARASSHGIQARAGADIERNVFARNPLTFFIGSRTDGTLYKRQMRARYNVILEGNDINSSLPRGLAIQHNSAYDALYEHNVVANIHSTQRYNKQAFQAGCSPSGLVAGTAGCKSVFQKNFVANWGNANIRGGAVSMGGMDSSLPGTHRVLDNTFVMLFQGARLVSLNENTTSQRYNFSGNTYVNAAIQSANSLFSAKDKSSMTFAVWKQSVESNAKGQASLSLPDPCRTLATYYDDVILGNTSNDNCKLMHDDKLFNALMNKLRTRSRLTPLPATYKTTAIINYIRQGFGLPKL